MLTTAFPTKRARKTQSLPLPCKSTMAFGSHEDMVSSDEDSALVKKEGQVDSKEDPLNPDNDPELEKNGKGGKFQSKVAILQVTWRQGKRQVQ
ncbi:unnamed protein product [Symbiodinium necroappetens]|uniref:Uncharacterized protein n=1 Tax=Symbiodinium necroappetens TaxID=1628268 RepID=A0A812ZHE5_9DINO|nr:unnamed protein product [Symbiodinium necroappetens]